MENEKNKFIVINFKYKNKIIEKGIYESVDNALIPCNYIENEQNLKRFSVIPKATKHILKEFENHYLLNNEYEITKKDFIVYRKFDTKYLNKDIPLYVFEIADLLKFDVRFK